MRSLVAVASLLLFACSSPREGIPQNPMNGTDAGVTVDSGIQEDGGGRLDGGITTDSGVTSDGGAPLGDPELEMVIGSFEGAQVVDENLDLLIGFPRHLDSSITGLPALDLEEGTAQTLAVESTVPLARIIAATYDRAAERTLILAYPQTAPGDGNLGQALEVFTFDGARLERLEPTNAPMVEGLAFSWFYPEGDGVHYRAFRFDEMSARATVQSGTVTWEPEVELSTDGFFDANQIRHDPTNHRLIAFGETAIEGMPPDVVERFVPSVFELSLGGGTHFSRVSAFGDVPPEQVSEFGFYGYGFFWDDAMQRLVVLMDHETEDPFGGMEPYLVTGAWALADGLWEVISDDLGFCCAPWIGGAADHARQRSLTGSGRGIDFTPGNEGRDIMVAAGVPPAPHVSGIDFDDGRLFARTGVGPAVLDVGAGETVWRSFFDEPVGSPPPGNDYSGFVFDAPRHRFLVFGDRVFAVESTSTGWVEQTTSGPVHDGPRGAKYLRAGDVVYAVGGLRYDETTGNAILSPRLSKLDLATMTWSTIADVGTEPRFLILRDANTLDVFFGANGIRVDLPTGQASPIRLTGDIPEAADGGGGVAAVNRDGRLLILAATEHDTTIYEEVAPLELRATASERDPHVAWSNYGAYDPVSGSAWFVGSQTWRVRWTGR